MSIAYRIREYTDKLNAQGLLRVRQVQQPVTLGLLHFDSNDYLSLSQDPRIARGYQESYRQFPCGSGSSMLLSGYHRAHQSVERAFADFLNVEECLLFSSGYAANLAVTALLGQIKAHCIIDKSVHASIYDGLTLSQVDYCRFIHHDLHDLTHKLKSYSEPSVVITEGIFSMSGNVAPLDQYVSLCAQNNSELIVDEAHSIGVLGAQGRGAVDFHGVAANDLPLRVIPLGKAFAAQGAIVAGKRDWIAGLLQAGRSLIYSTAISPALCYGLLNTLKIVAIADDRRLKLMQLIKVFKDHVNESPLQWSDSNTPIQQLRLGSAYLAQHYAKELKKLGISCSAIRAPTVTHKASGLRIIINYQHEPEDIQQLFDQLTKIYEHTLD